MENTRTEFYAMYNTILETKDCTKCINCGSTENINLHHVVPLAVGGTNNIDNIVPLCESCHGKIHGINWEGNSSLIKAGRVKAMSEGKFMGGKVNLGYKVIDGKLTVDTDIAPIIKTVYALYINEGTSAAVTYLNQTLKLHKNGSSLIQMLRNPIYKGYYNHDEDLYSNEDYKDISNYNKDLQIVSTDTWNKAIELMQQRRTSLKGNRCKSLNRTDYILEGLCYSYCDLKMNMDKSHGIRVFKSRCSCKDHQKTFNCEKIENVVLDKIFAQPTEISREEFNELSLLNKKLFIQNLTTKIIVRGYDNVEIIYQ